MDRCAVFVDAGYLFESAKTLLLAGHPGAALRANQTTLVKEIAHLAAEHTNLPLLRIYWYDAAPHRNPRPDQRELASLNDIKLRLGNLRERPGGRKVQKGVDAELHADMTGLARNRGAVDFVLLSGDEDLLRAVDEVQSYGVRLHLWGVEAGPDGGNQSLELIAASDRRHVLEEAWLRTIFTILEPPKPDSPTRPADDGASAPDAADGPAADRAAARPGTSGPSSAAPATTGGNGQDPATPSGPPTPGSLPKPTDRRPRATPLDVPAARAARDTILYTSSASWSGFSGPGTVFHRLSDLTTQAEQDGDAEEDASITFDAISVGRVYARRWVLRATPEAATQLIAEYPNIPRALDSELLRFALARGIDTWDGETDKFAVRQGFWSVFRQQSGQPFPGSGGQAGGPGGGPGGDA